MPARTVPLNLLRALRPAAPAGPLVVAGSPAAVAGAAPARRGAAGAMPAPPDAGRVIAAHGLVKDYHTEAGTRRVLDGVSFSVAPGQRMAVLGRNGAGKSTLIRILSGLERASAGDIHRGISMSWPIALGGAFEGSMTGYDNVRFVCRAYGVSSRDILDFVEDFTELGKQLYIPVRFYSDGMRARLAFALSLAIDFDCYLIDEVILVGDRRFQQRCHDELFSKRADRAMIIAIHHIEFVREFCDQALVLKRGRGRVFQDVKLATEIYATL